MASHESAPASSFEAVRDSVARLRPEEKIRLWQLLETEIGLAEEAIWEQDSTVQSEIREARAAYDGGEFVTLEEYLTDRSDRTE